MKKLFCLNNIAPKRRRKDKTRYGRGTGSGHGNMSGRGAKGQKSRSGGKVPSDFEGGQTKLTVKMPKIGMRTEQARYRLKVEEISTDIINAHLYDRESISIDDIKKALKINNKFPIKLILGKNINGDVHYKSIDTNRISSGAKKYLEDKGVKVNEIPFVRGIKKEDKK